MKLSECYQKRNEDKNQKKLWYYQKCVKFATPLYIKGNVLINCESSSGVEHHLAKVGVAGSNPVFRSIFKSYAEVVELVDTLDLKSNGH